MAGGSIVKMGRVKEPDLIETGTEPEFVATHIARYDPMPNGWVRLYIASHRSEGRDRIEYTVLVSPDDLSSMARECLSIAAEAHNANMFRILPKAAAN
jgi:hypothetical protein